MLHEKRCLFDKKIPNVQIFAIHHKMPKILQFIPYEEFHSNTSRTNLTIFFKLSLKTTNNIEFIDSV